MVCSYRLADIFAESAKKQSDIVIMMIELKTLFIIEVILSMVNEVPVLVPVRSVIYSVEPGTAFARAYLKLLIIAESAGLMNFTSSQSSGRSATGMLLNSESIGMLKSRAA